MNDIRTPGTVAEIGAAPHGAHIGAFFDLDGTLISGYSARHMATDQAKGRDLDPAQMLRTLGTVVAGGGLNPTTFEHLLGLTAQRWKGRTIEDLDEMGLRLFEKKISDLIFPEMKAIVAAHQRRGHTVVLTSSATAFQVEPVAAYLGIQHVLCNRFVDDDGVLTGEVAQPVLWGPGKANVAQDFATRQGVDLTASYFYADGNEDTALMYLVGNPRPTNPGSHMETVAKRRGWPVLRFSSRGQSSQARSLLAFASALPIAGVAAGLGLLKRDRRFAVNFATKTWTTTMMAINGVKLNVVDRHNAFAARPAVFVFNHRNNFDAFIATAIVERDFTAVAKGELRGDPIIGTAGRFLDVAFVDRANPAKAVEALKPIEEMAAKGLSVLIAPEGTRVDTTSVGPFKKGAFRIAMAAQIPIVPIVIRNAESIAGRNATAVNPGEVDVAVLEPIPVDDWTLRNLSERIAEVRQLFIDTLADWPTETTKPAGSAS